MPSLATLSAGLVINSIPFDFYVGDENYIMVWFFKIYFIGEDGFYITGGQIDMYYDEVEEVISTLMKMEDEVR